MFYNITALIIGILLFVISYNFIKSENGKIMFIISIFCGLGFIGSGVLGFLLSEELGYVAILVMLFFAFFYIISYIIFKKRLKSQASNNTISK